MATRTENKKKQPICTFIKIKARFLQVIIAVFITTLCVFNFSMKKVDRIYAQGSDTQAPTTVHSLNPSNPDGNNNWYISPVLVQLDATDLGSGVKKINYRVDGGQWLSKTFTGTQNRVTNPSFELGASTSTGATAWYASVEDPEATYLKTSGDYAPEYSNNSVKITSTAGVWHGINNKATYADAASYDNMTASIWAKTQDVTGNVFFNVYAVEPNGQNYLYTLLDTSPSISGTNDWTKLSVDFTVDVANAVGVYIDAGIAGPGTVWFDAASISTSLTNTSTTVTISSDSTNHTVEYYSEDYSGNIEGSSCTSPKNNCVEFKLDQTPPGNWSNLGSEQRSGNNHQLYVFVNVEDEISGLATDTGNSNKYQYTTHKFPEFGYYSDLDKCQKKDWESGGWIDLGIGVENDGDNSAYLETQRTNFCNSNWKQCKDVRFYAEDMAGNVDYKYWCLKGPWVKVRGEGIVRSNHNIDMSGEGNEDNTDGMIEAGGYSIDAFKSSKGWKAKSLKKNTIPNYEDLYEMTGDKTEIENGNLVADSGIYEVDGNLFINSSTIPGNYSNALFDQVVFVDGDILITNDILIRDESTALFIVNGNVQIDKSVNNIEIAVVSEGNLETAYNIDPENDVVNTLNLRGFYIADTIQFQRTLNDNENTPAENIVFEPKYVIQQKGLFETSDIEWTNKL